jgi:hypothetical protein
MLLRRTDRHPEHQHAHPECTQPRARRLEPAQDRRIFIDLVNAPFLFEHKGTPAEYKTGLEAAIGRG